MIDVNYKYAQWSTNVNVSGMNWQTYHEGMWFNPAEKSYSQAIEEIKQEVIKKITEDHPHLSAFKKAEQPKTNGKPEYGKSLTDHILSCNELKVLEAYKFMVRGKPEQEVYDQKYKELSNK